MSRFSMRNFNIVCLLSLVLVAIGLRFYHLDLPDLDDDEAFTALQSQYQIAEIVRISLSDNTLPLHALLLHYWSEIFGSSPTAVRSLSVIFDLLTIIVLFAFSNRLFGSFGKALAVLALYSFNFVAISHSRFTRTYSLLLFLGMISFYCALRFSAAQTKRERSIWGSLLVFGSALSLYSHNLGVFVILACFSYLSLDLLTTCPPAQSQKSSLFCRSALSNPEFLRKFLNIVILCVGVLILISPALFVIYRRLKTVSDVGFWLPFEPTLSLSVTLLDLTSGFHLTSYDKPNGLDVLLMYLSIGLFLIGSANALVAKTEIIQRKLPAVCFWIAVVGMFLLSYKSPVLYVRYVSFLNPLFILLVFQGISAINMPNYAKVGSVVLLCCLQFQTYFFHYIGPINESPRVKEAINYMKGNFQPNDAILLQYPYMFFFSVKYYADPQWEVKVFEPPEDSQPSYGGSPTSESDFTRNVDEYAGKTRIWWIHEAPVRTPYFFAEFCGEQQPNDSEPPNFIKNKYHKVLDRTFAARPDLSPRLNTQLWELTQ